MKILVFSHQLQFGGASVNAVELAAALRDRHGHEVVFFGAEGPMTPLVRARELPYIPAPQARFHPSPTRMMALRDVARHVKPDLIHVWEYHQCLEAYYFEYLVKRTPLLVTGMMMSVNRVLPKALPTTFGTPELVDLARGGGRDRVWLLVPPVDADENAPGAACAEPLRQQFGIRHDEVAIVSVSRFSSVADIKADSLFRLVSAMETLADLPVRLILVGDGAIRSDLERRAAGLCTRLGRDIIHFTGALTDPRPAYAAADVFVGMGGSALRAMAFGKPVVVVGADGFSREFSTVSADDFYYRGIYGVGSGRVDSQELSTQLRALCTDARRRAELGRFGRKFVVDRFALPKVAAELDAHCRAAVRDQPALAAATMDGLRSAAVWLRERRWYA